MPIDILFSGIVIAAVTWWMGSALGRMWTAQEKLREKVEDVTSRITRLETLAAPKAGDQREGDE